MPEEDFGEIVVDRRIFIVESKYILNENKTGFRQGRCTLNLVMKLVQETSDVLHNTAGRYRTSAAFFDYEKPYDKVWMDGLLNKKLKLEFVPDYLFSLHQTLLEQMERSSMIQPGKEQ